MPAWINVNGSRGKQVPISMTTTLIEVLLGLLLIAMIPDVSGASQKPETGGDIAPASAESYRHLAAEIEANLRTHVLDKWFPAAVDTAHGGFHQNFREDWSRDPREDRSLVYQARLTWISSEAALRYPSDAKRYLDASLHGLTFLEHNLWDPVHGGQFWALDDQGAPERAGEKHAYGISFAIYASAACYRATKDARALYLAKRTFYWLDQHAHDGARGGYYEALTREGKPIFQIASSGPASDFIGTHYGYKSMNTHIHLLEALTGLFEVWPDPNVKKRLKEVFLIVRDRINVPPGCLNLFFTPDWRPVPDHDSFGHDVETAYLLVEAAAALGDHDDPKTWTASRQLLDHALKYGWDEENGGFYDAGTAFGPPLVTDKIWWTQAEGLNALMLMHTKYAHETDKYWQAFNRQWRFIREHQVDPVHGGWYAVVSREGKPVAGHIKSDRWTEAYHQGRALLVVSQTLRRLAAKKGAAPHE
jgi:mannobiose 2-epimerase